VSKFLTEGANGTLVRSEIHLDESGEIREGRTLRNVLFPLDRALIKQGTNILAFRILGDPTSANTGFYYVRPYYLDDYRIIEARERNFLPMILGGIFCFIGIYYFMHYLSAKNKKEMFYLYFSIFSILLFIYTITRFDIINFMIPNSYICFRLEYLSLFLMGSMVCIFVEELGWQKISLISKVYLALCLFLAVTQIFFCNQFAEDILPL
jgi:hypothetical protein